MARMIFVNLPVTDLARATAFYQAIGAERNPQFSDDTASCMVFSETIYAMLMTHDKFKQFTPKPISDAKTSNQACSACRRTAAPRSTTSSARPSPVADAAILRRSTTTAGCTAAALRIRTVTCGE